MSFFWRRSFREAGIVGMNARNLNYILPYNSRSLYPLVDDKMRTKQLAEKAGIATPKLFNLIESQGQITNIAEWANHLRDFVIKPAHGSGGNGIVIISERVRAGYLKSSGQTISDLELYYHISKTLSGLYSLGGRSDQVIVEEKVNFDSLFEKMTYQGVPDIRVLVFQGVPTMAMVRLPTRESDGKANLHMGGVGVGIDMGTGKTIFGVQHNKIVNLHPDTGHAIAGVTIPDWDKLLVMASTFYDLTGLGYLGVDIVLDKDKGPMILELNARPGLSIQIANQEGLQRRLDLVEANIKQLKTVADKVAFAKENFRARHKA